VTHWWCRNRKKFGVDCTIHDLRHAFLTSLALQGISPAVIQRIAGHSSPMMALQLYTHVCLEDQRRAMETVNGLLYSKNVTDGGSNATEMHPSECL
jgi:integrase